MFKTDVASFNSNAYQSTIHTRAFGYVILTSLIGILMMLRQEISRV